MRDGVELCRNSFIDALPQCSYPCLQWKSMFCTPLTHLIRQRITPRRPVPCFSCVLPWSFPTFPYMFRLCTPSRRNRGGWKKGMDGAESKEGRGCKEWERKWKGIRKVGSDVESKEEGIRRQYIWLQPWLSFKDKTAWGLLWKWVENMKKE